MILVIEAVKLTRWSKYI